MANFNFKQKKGDTRKSFKYEDSPDRHREKPDVITMIKKMQQQLMFLERKIDILIGQSPAKFSKSGGHSSRYEGGTRNDSSGERNFHKGKKSFSSKRSPRS